MTPVNQRKEKLTNYLIDNSGLRWAPLNKPEFMSTGCGIPFHYPVTLKETIQLDLILDSGDVLSGKTFNKFASYRNLKEFITYIMKYA